MPRIIIPNPLGTVGEGLAAGSDLVRREQEHQARLKAFEADLDQAARRTRMAEEQMQWEREDRARAEQSRAGLRDLSSTLSTLTPQQKEMFSRLDDKNIPLALQMVEADREQAELTEHRRMLEVETLAATSDPEYPVDAQMAQSVALQYADSPAEGRAALKQLRARQRHMTLQTQQRSFARGEVSTLMATFPEAFRKALPGTAPTAQQELIEDLLDELDDDPLEPDAGQKDYLGALAELRVLADPTLAGAHRRMEARYRADFEAAMQVLVPHQGMGPQVPIGVQDVGDEEAIRVQQAVAGANAAVPEAQGGSDAERDSANVVGGAGSAAQDRLTEMGKPPATKERKTGELPSMTNFDSWTDVPNDAPSAYAEVDGVTGAKEKGTVAPQPSSTDRSGIIEAAARVLARNGLSPDRTRNSDEFQKLGVELTDEEWREARKLAIKKGWHKQ